MADSESVFIELGPQAALKLRELADRFGEADLARMVSRALGLTETVEKYFSDGGTLTVVDQSSQTLPETEAQVRGLPLKDVTFTKWRRSAKTKAQPETV